MKHMNDIEIEGVIGAEFVMDNIPSPIKKSKEIRVVFPMVWSHGGLSNLITCSAIGETARGLYEYAKPGQPLFVTGTLVMIDGAMRCRVVSSDRLSTSCDTIEVMGEFGPLLSLDGGKSEVQMRGKIPRDSAVLGDHFKTDIAVQNLVTNREERYPIVTTVPLFTGQSVSVRGQFTRFLNESETDGVIVAARVSVTERLLGPATRVRRDPSDRLRLDRLEFDAAPSN